MARHRAADAKRGGTPGLGHRPPSLSRPLPAPLSPFAPQVPECTVEIKILTKSSSPNSEHKVAFRGVAVTIPITVPDWKTDMPVMVVEDDEHEERRSLHRRRTRKRRTVSA
jgi:hypothetical protein